MKKRRKNLVLAIASVAVLALGLAIPTLVDNVRVNKTAANLHALQLAIERYQIDEPTQTELYPNSIQEAVDAGELISPSLPINPYSHKPMRVVPIGEMPGPGDYSYIPLREEIAPGYWFPTKYLLVAYSSHGGRVSPVEYVKMFPDSELVQWKYVCVALYGWNEGKRDRNAWLKTRRERFLNYVKGLSPEEKAQIQLRGAK